MTAVSGSARRTVGFYTEALGLRLVKKTVNFDDPGAYHLYFGDREGRPGTVLTFFVWPQVHPGRRGAGKALSLAFRVPPESLGRWRARLNLMHVDAAPGRDPFREELLALRDPDGMDIELVGAVGAPPAAAWTGADVEEDMAIRGLGGVRLAVAGAEPSARFLEATMGMRVVGDGRGVHRLETPGSFVDLEERAPGGAGFIGTGSIHHVAWRTPDEASQLDWRERLAAAGRLVTEVIDRIYFRSIYFREPGGVLFEIATDTPGFAADEPVESLGSSLMLPPWLEGERRQIEATLPAF